MKERDINLHDSINLSLKELEQTAEKQEKTKILIVIDKNIEKLKIEFGKKN